MAAAQRVLCAVFASLAWLAAAGAAHAQRRAVRPRWVDPAARSAPVRARLAALDGQAGPATVDGIRYLLDLSERRSQRRADGAPSPWLERADRYVTQLEQGLDPYAEARGEITLRAYRSEVSESLQAYAVYLPLDYDPDRAYPLLVALHGGSSNGNLFLAQTLGVHVPWGDYRAHHHVVHRPVDTPPWIVVAPDGFGNSMWRYMGERDVLDVLADVQRHHRIDPDRVVLYGLSNGGLGSFNIGMRHAWRFAAVVPLAGAPGWVHYVGDHLDPVHRSVLEPQSAWALIENALNTHLHAHHGRRDPGPMRPAYVDALSEHVRTLGVPFELDWYATGHDLVPPVHRQGGVFEREAAARRDPRPSAVTLVTGDYRASRQHWVGVTRIEGYPALARVQARIEEGAVEVRTARVCAMMLHLDEAPLASGPVTLRIDGDSIALPRAGAVDVVRREGRWTVGLPGEPGLAKRPGLSGPIGDAYWERLIHVYGTRDPAHEATLREAAERGARSFVPHVHTVHQRVMADRDVTPELAARAHLVLYGGPGDNAVLERLWDRLPIRVAADGITVGDQQFVGRLGTRFVYPSPLAPGRYLLVQAGTSADAVLAGDALPAFLPDYVVYDARRMPESRPNLPRHGYVAAGFFDDRWALPASTP